MNKACLLLFIILIIAAVNCSKPDEPTGPETPIKTSGMVVIPGNSFSMGSITGTSDELPVHTISVDTFSIDVTEVTQGSYDSLMSQTYAYYYSPSWSASYGLGPNYPAYYINWYDAVLYCNARSKHDGLDTIYSYTYITGTPGNDCTLGSVTYDLTRNGYRLPTEAEWEYAARSHTTGDYIWGTTTTLAFYYAWYSGNADNQVHPVAQKFPNQFGLYDIIGNVLEWCHDWYGSSYYSSSPVRDEGGPVTGSGRVYRGGSIISYETELRTPDRNYNSANYETYYYGFRCVQRGAVTRPVAVAGPDVIAAPYQAVTLTATGTSENGPITTYYWALDGLNFWPADTTTLGQKQVTFNAPGEDLVLVKVRDAAGVFSLPDTIFISIRQTVPTNRAPANGTVIGVNNVTFYWVPGSYNHHFQVRFDPTTPPVTVVAASVTDTFFALTTTLSYNTVYYWQIVGVNDVGDESPGSIWSFTTSGPPPVLKNIPGGTFPMGSAAGPPNEQPVHSVTMAAFFMDSTEVTQKEFAEVMKVNPSRFVGDSLPVDQVTWYDAVLFCNARSVRDGYDTVYAYAGRPTGTPGSGCTGLAALTIDYTKNGYRLPTEGEWEYACRAGGSTNYHFGDSEAELGNYAWYVTNAGNTTHPPAQKLPNAHGLYDMHGNLFEWCNDWYQATYYASSPAADPPGPASGTQKVLRGGSFGYAAAYLRCALRLNYYPYDQNSYNGFRCVRKQ